MKNFAYYIGMFIIVAVMFAFSVLAILSFCLGWDIMLKCLFIGSTVVDFTLVVLAILWCVDFNDD